MRQIQRGTTRRVVSWPSPLCGSSGLLAGAREVRRPVEREADHRDAPVLFLARPEVENAGHFERARAERNALAGERTHQHRHGLGRQVGRAAARLVAGDEPRREIEGTARRQLHVRHEADQAHALALQRQQPGGWLQVARRRVEEFMERKRRRVGRQNAGGGEKQRNACEHGASESRRRIPSAGRPAGRATIWETPRGAAATAVPGVNHLCRNCALSFAFPPPCRTPNQGRYPGSVTRTFTDLPAGNALLMRSGVVPTSWPSMKTAAPDGSLSMWTEPGGGASLSNVSAGRGAGGGAGRSLPQMKNPAPATSSATIVRKAA